MSLGNVGTANSPREPNPPPTEESHDDSFEQRLISAIEEAEKDIADGREVTASSNKKRGHSTLHEISFSEEDEPLGVLAELPPQTQAEIRQHQNWVAELNNHFNSCMSTLLSPHQRREALQAATDSHNFSLLRECMAANAEADKKAVK